MKFAICDGNPKDLDLIGQQLTKAMTQLGINAEIEKFGSAEELLKSAENTFYSVFIFDIILPGISGLDASLKLRRDGNYSPIIFTTVTKDYLSQCYSVCAARHLVKPIAPEDLREALSYAMKLLAGNEKLLEITIARHTEKIPYADIYYVEGNFRNSLIHTNTGIYNPYLLVQELATALDDKRFYHCHRSYIINLDHVVAVLKDKVAMRNDVLLAIRRGSTEDVRQAWEKRRFDLIRGIG